MKDGFGETKEYKSWDFFTGLPLVIETASASKVKTREERIPAYCIQYNVGSTLVKPYADMGLKSMSGSNKNMVSQMAASYVYLLDGSNIAVGLLGANVQTWKSNWNNYRIFNAASGVYENAAEGPGVWRKNTNHIWLGSYAGVRPDGSQNFATTDKYNFNPVASNLLWKKYFSINQYDHYSLPLEVSDIPGMEANAIHTSVKMGYDNKETIASASNAKYKEIAFSSAEDLQSNDYFGGEVMKGEASVVNTLAHAGKNSISLSSGYGFIFKASGLPGNKPYRVSVWTNSANGRIYYKINGVEHLSSAPSGQKKVGNWYLLDFEIPPQSMTFSVEVGVKSVLGVTLFDDFRFQPADAVMTGYVYNPSTNHLEYVLNNDNLYTRFEYDDRGVLVRTYDESLKFGEKLTSESRHDFRRFHVD